MAGDEVSNLQRIRIVELHEAPAEVIGKQYAVSELTQPLDMRLD